MRRWILCSLAASLVTLGSSALAKHHDRDDDDDRPPVYQPYGNLPPQYHALPEDHDRYVPQDSDGVDPEERAQIQYNQEMARCGLNWMCKRRVHEEWSEHRRFRF